MPKKPELPPELSLLKKSLDKECNLIDYFLICGIPPLLSDYENLPPPKILSKFPPFDKAHIGIDDGIITYLFPNDSFRIQNFNSIPQSKFFSFILDNNVYSYDQPQKYVSALMIYEPLSTYKTIELKSKNDETVISFKNKNSPYHKLLNLYVPKIIAVVSVCPYINTHQKILSALYSYSQMKNVQLPIEKLIQSLVIEVPMPPRGIVAIDYSLLNVKINLKNSKLNEVSYKNYDMRVMFKLFNSDKVIEIYKSLLYENKIIFFSKNANYLTNCILTLLSLLYPFKYPFQVATPVPKANYNIIESISPFIFGINEAYVDTFFDDNEFDIEDTTILVVDIDKSELILKTKETFSPLPYKATEKIKEDIELLLSSQSDDKSQIDEEFNKKISECFFEYVANIIKNYESHLNNEYYTSKENIQNTNINTLFHVDDFINYASYYDRPFYTKFVNDSQMFVEFIYKRMLPKNTIEKIDVMFINEKILDINNKSSFFPKDTPLTLTSSSEFNIKSTYVVPKQKELSSNELSYISSLTPSTYLSYYGAEISSQKFSYFLFPVMDPIYYSEENIKNYIPSPDFSNDIDVAAGDIAVKNANVDMVEMRNYVYVAWLELWAFSFSYNEKQERRYRFNQMIDILDKVIHLEMEIVDVLFEALAKANEDDMILRLYTKMIAIKINPSIYVHNLINKIIDRKSMNNLVKKKTMKNVDVDINNSNTFKYIIQSSQRRQFSKRTIKSFPESEVISDRITFYRYTTCIECQNKIDLFKTSIDFANMKKDVMWAMCPHCGTFLLPKIAVKTGIEFASDFDSMWTLNSSTATTDEVVLHSPFDMKNNVKDIVNDNVLDVVKFKAKFTAMFYNALWYFSINQISFEFLLPYRKDVEQSEICENDEITVSYFNNIESDVREIIARREKFDDVDVVYAERVDYVPMKRTTTMLSSLIDTTNMLNESGFVNTSTLLENSVNYDMMSKFSDSENDIGEIRNKIRFNRLKSIKEDEKDENNVEFDLNEENVKNILNFEDNEDNANFNIKDEIEKDEQNEILHYRAKSFEKKNKKEISEIKHSKSL